MFSTTPRMSPPSCFTRRTAFVTTIVASAWGVVTSTTPDTGSACITVSGASLVPGGRSTMRKSSSPHGTSLKNCRIARDRRLQRVRARDARLLAHAEHPRDARAGDVAVEHADSEPAALEADREEA